jgi:hypothetical protein
MTTLRGPINPRGAGDIGGQRKDVANGESCGQYAANNPRLRPNALSCGTSKCWGLLQLCWKLLLQPP